MTLPDYLWLSTKKNSSFGPDVWPGICNIYMNVLMFYYIDILEGQEVYSDSIILYTSMAGSILCEHKIYLEVNQAVYSESINYTWKAGNML